MKAGFLGVFAAIFIMHVPMPVKAAGSVGFLAGLGSFGQGSFPVSSYGLSISGRREKPEGQATGELALSFISHGVSHSLGQTALSTYALDLRRRFSGQFGFFLGLDLAYFSSGNENLISSGFGAAPQLGYDFRITEHISLGAQGQWYFGRSFPSAMVTLKLSN